MLRALLTLANCLSSLTFAADDAARVYRDLERHLRSLKSLDIRYEAGGASVSGELLSGRMVWQRPGLFYHDTPEWTLCDRDSAEWRYLKETNTLILDRAADAEHAPEAMLTNLSRDLRAAALDIQADGRMWLSLSSDDPAAPRNIVIEFPAGSRQPDLIRYTLPDGTDVDYRIRSWNEAQLPAPALFVAPEVPAENLIDFRLHKSER